MKNNKSNDMYIENLKKEAKVLAERNTVQIRKVNKIISNGTARIIRAALTGEQKA